MAAYTFVQGLRLDAALDALADQRRFMAEYDNSPEGYLRRLSDRASAREATAIFESDTQYLRALEQRVQQLQARRT